MSKLLFPIALIIILAAAALAHYELQGPPAGTAPGGTRAPDRVASPDPGGTSGASSAPVPQAGGSGQ